MVRSHFHYCCLSIQKPSRLSKYRFFSLLNSKVYHLRVVRPTICVAWWVGDNRAISPMRCFDQAFLNSYWVKKAINTVVLLSFLQNEYYFALLCIVILFQSHTLAFRCAEFRFVEIILDNNSQSIPTDPSHLSNTPEPGVPSNPARSQRCCNYWGNSKASRE